MARLNPFVRVLVNDAHRWRLSYSQFSEYAKEARHHLGFKSARSPWLLSNVPPRAMLRSNRLDPERHSSDHAQAPVLYSEFSKRTHSNRDCGCGPQREQNLYLLG
jgi:hypothetical protein